MKERVHYAILEDMQKYVKVLDIKKYEETTNDTDDSVISYLRDYYDKNLPVDVDAWIRVNEPNESLIYASGLGEQVCFVRDRLCGLLFPDYEKWENNPPLVISTHRSKSVKLPVFKINLEEYGIEMILRYNFYDWKVSINSDKPLEFDFMEVFNPKDVYSSCICEGFPKDKVYGSYEQNHSQFTIEIDSNYDLYTFVFLLKNYLGIKSED